MGQVSRREHHFISVLFIRVLCSTARDVFPAPGLLPGIPRGHADRAGHEGLRANAATGDGTDDDDDGGDDDVAGGDDDDRR